MIFSPLVLPGIEPPDSEPFASETAHAEVLNHVRNEGCRVCSAHAAAPFAQDARLCSVGAGLVKAYLDAIEQENQEFVEFVGRAPARRVPCTS